MLRLVVFLIEVKVMIKQFLQMVLLAGFFGTAFNLQADTGRASLVTKLSSETDGYSFLDAASSGGDVWLLVLKRPRGHLSGEGVVGLVKAGSHANLVEFQPVLTPLDRPWNRLTHFTSALFPGDKGVPKLAYAVEGGGFSVHQLIRKPDGAYAFGAAQERISQLEFLVQRSAIQAGGAGEFRPKFLRGTDAATKSLVSWGRLNIGSALATSNNIVIARSRAGTNDVDTVSRIGGVSEKEDASFAIKSGSVQGMCRSQAEGAVDESIVLLSEHQAPEGKVTIIHFLGQDLAEVWSGDVMVRQRAVGPMSLLCVKGGGILVSGSDASLQPFLYVFDSKGERRSISLLNSLPSESRQTIVGASKLIQAQSGLYLVLDLFDVVENRGGRLEQRKSIAIVALEI